MHRVSMRGNISTLSAEPFPSSEGRRFNPEGLVIISLIGFVAMAASIPSTSAFSFGVRRYLMVHPGARIGPNRSVSTQLLPHQSLLGGLSVCPAKAFRRQDRCEVNVERSKVRSSFASRHISSRLFATVKGETADAQSPDEPSQLEDDYSSDDPFTMRLAVPTPEDMEDVGAVLSMGTGGGDTILLGGDLGAGKTCLSRGFVQARTGDPDMRVTSPTYLLSNSYPADGGDIIVYHMDLYRLKGGEDLEPLDMDNVVKNGICLIEWPSRLGEELPPDRLDITFRIHDGDETEEEEDEESITRFLTLRAHSQKWEQRLKTLEAEGYLDDLLLD
mmetsp:Transcript_58618/g.174498  ORF Transcript_58618/g.174498 Transcript_58618/m.174498 type:complete len:331 (-) Transcript_58618:223-1215(-)